MKTGFSFLTFSLTLATGVLSADPPSRRYPVALYLFNTCSPSWSQGVANITADGQCHYIPPHGKNPSVDPGPYYSAIPTDATGDSIQFLKAECSDPTCTNCDEYSSWLEGPTSGLFNMTKQGCQDVIFSSFIVLGPGELIDPPVVSPPTAMPVSIPTRDNNVSVPLTGTNASSTGAFSAGNCSWNFRYYNLSEATSFLGSCNVVGLVQPTETATIVPDGKCHDSGTMSLGFYQAMCDSNGGIIFLQNKCYDASCMACDPDSNVYTGTSYQSGECSHLDTSIFQSWVLRGSCDATCGGQQLPTMAPASQTSVFSMSSLP